MTDDDGKRLRGWRLGHRYSQAQLATLLNEQQGVTSWHQTSVAKVEAGERVLTLDVLRAYCGVFNLSVDELLEGERFESPDESPYERLFGADSARMDALRLERNAHVLRVAEIDYEIAAINQDWAELAGPPSEEED